MSAIYLQCLVCGALYRPPNSHSGKVKTITSKEDHELIPLTKEHPKANSLAAGDDKQNSLITNDMSSCDDEINTASIYKLASTGSLNLIPWSFYPDLNSSEQEESKPKKKCASLINILICLKNPVVLFYCIYNFFVFIGFFNFILLMPGDAISKGIEYYRKALLVSFAGFGDLAGRLTVAGVGDRLPFARYKFNAASCLLNGINIFIYGFATEYWWMGIHSALYGYLGGIYVALNSVVLIDFVGVKVLPKALSLVMVSQGIAIVMGQPFLGEYTKVILISFYIYI